VLLIEVQDTADIQHLQRRVPISGL